MHSYGANVSVSLPWLWGAAGDRKQAEREFFRAASTNVEAARIPVDSEIVTAESMGFPLAAGLSLRVGKPYVFIRKREYRLPGEVSLKQTTGYAKTDMFINNIHRGDRIVFVDDVISTGGTLFAIVKALRTIGAEITDVVIVFEKTREKKRMEAELGLKIKTLLRVDVVKGQLVERT